MHRYFWQEKKEVMVRDFKRLMNKFINKLLVYPILIYFKNKEIVLFFIFIKFLFKYLKFLKWVTRKMKKMPNICYIQKE